MNLWTLLAPAMALDIKKALDPFQGTLLAPIMIPRTPGSANITKVRHFITDHFEALGWTVDHEKFTADTPKGPIEMANIVVHKNRPAKYTLSAHYDSKIEPEGFIGAIDSAVPCALLLYVASALKDKDLDVDFVFFDGEEAIETWTDDDSIYGARVHAASDHEIQTLVLLDLLGFKSAPIPSWFSETWDLHYRLQKLNAELGSKGLMQYQLLSGEVHKYAGQMLDDHIPFWKKGVKCLHLIPHAFPPIWHTIDDDAEHLDPEFVHDWAVLLREWIDQDAVIPKGDFDPDLDGDLDDDEDEEEHEEL